MQPIAAECRDDEIADGEIRYIRPHGGNHARTIAQGNQRRRAPFAAIASLHQNAITRIDGHSPDPDQHLIRRWFWIRQRDLFQVFQSPVLKTHGFHKSHSFLYAVPD
jgi:aerobic-type carbon monoxide dehydrogenase small subunit (CoxS/CutS family)